MFKMRKIKMRNTTIYTDGERTIGMTVGGKLTWKQMLTRIFFSFGVVIAFLATAIGSAVLAFNTSGVEKPTTTQEEALKAKRQIEEEARQMNYSMYLKSIEGNDASDSKEDVIFDDIVLEQENDYSEQNPVDEASSITNAAIDAETEEIQFFYDFNGYMVSQEDVNLIVKAVQHEVRNDPDSFPGYDFDTIQQCMALAILNRVGKPGFADSVYGVICQPGQFMPLEDLTPFDAEDPTTLKNVIAVLEGRSKVNAPDLVFEMSFTSLDAHKNVMSMEEKVGDVVPYYSAVNNQGRYLLFAEKVS